MKQKHSSRALRLGLLIVSLLAAQAALAEDVPGKTKPRNVQSQIEALARQLEQVQAQLQALTEENKSLVEEERRMEARQRELEAQLAHVAGPEGSVAGNANAVPAVPAANPVPPATAANPVPSSAAASPVPPSMPTNSVGAALLGGLKLWGYGEAYYTRPSRDPKNSQADLARAVFGIGYQFDSRTEFNSEFEVEHAVSSASDPGEFEVEQFYVDRELGASIGLRAGLFLMPFGLLNENHEPTNFYGVQRNFVETLIIPSTWREGGLNLHGDTPIGVRWNLGVTTGFDLSRWNFAPEFPLYTTALNLEDSDAAPLQATHQELALANAEHLSQYLAIGYYGVPGLVVGGAIFTGDAVKVPAPPNAPIPGNQRVTFYEGHARWTPGSFDLSALYAHGAIGNLGLANFANPGSPNPIPSSFYGWYLQGAYTAWEQDEYRLAPFVRWEIYNLGSNYEGTIGPVLPVGFVPVSGNPGDYGYWPINQDRVWTLGASFFTTSHVVFKADYQRFRLNPDFSRFDLGVGVAF